MALHGACFAAFLTFAYQSSAIYVLGRSRSKPAKMILFEDAKDPSPKVEQQTYLLVAHCSNGRESGPELSMQHSTESPTARGVTR